MYKIGAVAAGVVGMGSVRDCWEGVPLTITPLQMSIDLMQQW